MSIRRLLDMQVWAVSKHDEYWYLHGPTGHIATRAQWEELKTKVDCFYAQVPDKEIDEANAEADEGVRRRYEQPRTPTRRQRTKSGYIYLLQGKNTPWYKIGISEKPKQRFKQLGTLAPFKLRVIAMYKVEDTVASESGWHALFAPKRAEGEWFELNDDDVALFIEQQGQATT